MPIVNIEEVEKKASKVVADTNQIVTKEIGGKTYFKGPFLADWFDTYGECQQENQRFSQQKAYKDAGLDEFGRTPAQLALSKAKSELLKQKEEFLKKAQEIDVKIGALKEEDFIKKEKKK